MTTKSASDIAPCPLCDGKGWVRAGFDRFACPQCKGSGEVRDSVDDEDLEGDSSE